MSFASCQVQQVESQIRGPLSGQHPIIASRARMKCQPLPIGRDPAHIRDGWLNDSKCFANLLWQSDYFSSSSIGVHQHESSNPLFILLKICQIRTIRLQTGFRCTCGRCRLWCTCRIRRFFCSGWYGSKCRRREHRRTFNRQLSRTRRRATASHHRAERRKNKDEFCLLDIFHRLKTYHFDVLFHLSQCPSPS